MRFSSIIIPTIISMAIGSVISVYFDYAFNLSIIFIPILTLLFAYTLRRKLFMISFIIICLISIMFGFIRGGQLLNNLRIHSELSNYVDKYSYFEGLITNNPEVKNDKQVFVFRSSDLNIEVKAPLFPLLYYGDQIKIFGKLRVPENFITPNGNEVRYYELERARNISYLLEAKRFEIISVNNGNAIYNYIYKLKRGFSKIINRLPSPESGLYFSMVFGGKSNLPDYIIEYFRIAGLLHIVVLSGQNLTIVSYITLKIFNKSTGFRAGHFLALITILLYAIMGGLEAATIRALFVSSLLIISSLLGRPALAPRILVLSASLMIINNPYILLDDPSFQLSILAFSGILFISPIIERILIIKMIPNKFAEYLAAIFGAQLAVLPFLMYSTQSITPYSFVANFFSLIVVGVVTIYGMISVLIGIISIHIFDILSYPIFFVLKYIILIAKITASLPFAIVNIKIPFYSVVIIYVFMIIYIERIWRNEYMNPINIYTLKNNAISIKKGRLPWIHPSETATAFDNTIDENKIINW